MTYEPGTADIMTTYEPPFTPGEQYAVLRTVFRRAGRQSGIEISREFTGPRRLHVPDVAITDTEYRVLCALLEESV
jgi:hypothetical protein